MRRLALLPLVLAACGTPLPGEAPPPEAAPVPHIAGVIGPIADIDHDGELVTSDGGYGYSATVTADTGNAWVMTRLSVRDATTLAPGLDRTFAFANDEGVALVGCAGSAEGQWDYIDAPADEIRVQIDDDALVSVTARLRGSETLTETSFSLSR